MAFPEPCLGSTSLTSDRAQKKASNAKMKQTSKERTYNCVDKPAANRELFWIEGTRPSKKPFRLLTSDFLILVISLDDSQWKPSSALQPQNLMVRFRIERSVYMPFSESLKPYLYLAYNSLFLVLCWTWTCLSCALPVIFYRSRLMNSSFSGFRLN